jgi:hypothetical protein
MLYEGKESNPGPQKIKDKRFPTTPKVSDLSPAKRSPSAIYINPSITKKQRKSGHQVIFSIGHTFFDASLARNTKEIMARDGCATFLATTPWWETSVNHLEKSQR